MLRIWLGCLLVLLLPASAGAGSWTLTSTADQDAALTWVVQQENAKRAALSPPQAPLTEPEYLQALFSQALDSYRAQKIRAAHEQRKEDYQKAPADVKQKVDNYLKCGKDTCP